MITKKNLIIVALLSFCIAALLFSAIPVIGQTGEYDPWLDINDDGYIGIDDIFAVASHFGAEAGSGDINKTELLLRVNTTDFQSGLLIHLPYRAVWADFPYDPQWEWNFGILHSIDLDQSRMGDQQSIIALAGTTITVTGEFQTFAPDGHSGDVLQMFFIYSWTPTWPPPNSTYYYGLYNGMPGGLSWHWNTIL
jgi:hypothetical protein